MNDDQSRERAARAWIEEGPAEAPDRAVDAALARVASTRQDRKQVISWQLGGLGRTPRLMAVAAMVAVGVIGGAILLSGGPAPRPIERPSAPIYSPFAASSPLQSTSPSSSPTPSPTPAASIDLASVFTSSRYGYSIGVSADWEIIPAALTWFGPDNSPPVVDEIIVTGTDSEITAASQALSPGQTLDEWLVGFGAYGTLSLACRGGDPSTWPPVQVGNVTGRWQQMCNAAEAVAESGGRVYVFSWGNGTFDANQHLSVEQFKRVLGTVRFDPSAVPPHSPPPTLGARFTSPRLGYSISNPDGWSVTPATASAANGTPINYGDPTLDDLEGTDVRLTVSSVPLDQGQTAEEWAISWCTLYSDPGTDCTSAPATWPRIAVGSASGWVDWDGTGTVASVAEGGRLFEAIVVSDGRGYSFSLDGAVERPLFEALMASVTFDPSTAVDASPLPQPSP